MSTEKGWVTSGFFIFSLGYAEYPVRQTILTRNYSKIVSKCPNNGMTRGAFWQKPVNNGRNCSQHLGQKPERSFAKATRDRYDTYG